MGAADISSSNSSSRVPHRARGGCRMKQNSRRSEVAIDRPGAAGEETRKWPAIFHPSSTENGNAILVNSMAPQECPAGLPYKKMPYCTRTAYPTFSLFLNSVSFPLEWKTGPGFMPPFSFLSCVVTIIRISQSRTGKSSNIHQ